MIIWNDDIYGYFLKLINYLQFVINLNKYTMLLNGWAMNDVIILGFKLSVYILNRYSVMYLTYKLYSFTLHIIWLMFYLKLRKSLYEIYSCWKRAITFWKTKAAVSLRLFKTWLWKSEANKIRDPPSHSFPRNITFPLTRFLISYRNRTYV